MPDRTDAGAVFEALRDGDHEWLALTWWPTGDFAGGPVFICASADTPCDACQRLAPMRAPVLELDRSSRPPTARFVWLCPPCLRHDASITGRT